MFKQKKKLLLTLALLLAAGAVCWWFFGHKAAEQGADTPAYSYQQAKRGDIIATLEGVGTVQPVNSYIVKALVTGEVLSAPFDEGDMIEAGTLLYRIDAGKAQNSYTAAQLDLQEAEQAMADLNVTAPADGQIVKIFYDVGDSVSAGSVLIYLRDREQMLLDVPFKTADTADITVGQQAAVTPERGGGTVSGVVETIGNVEQVRGSELVYMVQVRVPNPGTIQDGDWGSAVIGSHTCVDSGLFSYAASEQVLAKASGDIAEIPVQEGERVAKGQTLIQLADDIAANKLRRARLELANAENTLTNYTITSPIAGTVIEKKFEQGDTIDSNNSASEMAVIYDMSRLEFVMNVDELDIGLLHVGQPVQVTADAVGGALIAGYVSKISIKGESSNGVTTYPITVTLEDFGELLPGMNVNAEVVLQQAENVVIVPMRAVSRGNMLLVEGADGEPSDLPGYTWRAVELGMNDDYYVEVISGISEGEKFAVPNQAGGAA